MMNRTTTTSTTRQSMGRFINSLNREFSRQIHSISYPTKRIDVFPTQRYNFYSTSNIVWMPKKTIEVKTLPGPEFVDSEGKLIDRAKVTEIFFKSKRRVFGGDAILAIEKEGIAKNNLKRELSYVLSPVSGHIIRYHVKVKDYIRVGDPLYDIETMDNYETSHEAVTAPPPKVVETFKRKLVFLPLPKETLRYYKLIQNEVDNLQDEIKKLKLSKQSPSSDATDLPVANTTPTLVNTTAPPALTPEITKLMYDKLEIYERILMLKYESYQNTVNTLTSLDMENHVISQYQRINESDPLDVASTHRSMGLIYMRLENWNDAHENMKEAVLLRRLKNRHSDYQHFDLLQDVLVHLGTIKHQKGEVEGARRCLYEAFRLQTRYLGHSYHPIIANTVHLLGEVYYDMGKLDEALRSYGVAKNIFCDVGTSLPKDQIPKNLPQIPSAYFGPSTSINELRIRYKIETAKVLHNLSIVHEQLGKRRLAIESAIQELRLRKSVLPANDVTIATCHYMIGDLFVADGGKQKKDPPINHFLAALSIYESNYGYHHKTVAMTYISMGALYLRLKKHDDAYESYKKGLEILEVTEGKSNSDVATAYLYAGQALFEKGKDFCEDALKYFFHAYGILKDFTITTMVENYQIIDDPGGKGNSVQLILTSAIESIGNAYKEQGNVEEAIIFYHQAVKLVIAKIGRKQHDVARIYFTLAQTLAEQKDYDEAWKHFTIAKEIFASIYGDKHPETASCYYNIGLVLREYPSRTVEALEALQKAHDRWLKEYGPDNVNVVDVEKCIRELEQNDDAETG